MEKIISALFNCIRYEIGGDGLSSAYFASMTEQEFISLYKLSKQHDVANLVGDALIKNGISLPTEVGQKFQKQVLNSVFRYENQSVEINKVCETFDVAKIDYILLKGSVIRSYYPEPWMRTSTDVDILVRYEDLDRAAEVLQTELLYVKNSVGDHDIHFMSQSGVALELHFRLIEGDVVDNASKVLQDVWQYAYILSGSRYAMSNEMLYYYHIAHMAKHFVNGGCGIRPFIDLYFLDKTDGIDKIKLGKLMSDGALNAFFAASVRLKDVWLCCKTHDELSQKMQSYLIFGGAFGTRDNYVAATQSKKGGKVGYLFSRVWRPYEVLKDKYHGLAGRKYLLPYYEAKRWIELLSIKGKAKQCVSEIKANADAPTDKSKAIGDMLIQLGL